MGGGGLYVVGTVDGRGEGESAVLACSAVAGNGEVPGAGHPNSVGVVDAAEERVDECVVGHPYPWVDRRERSGFMNAIGGYVPSVGTVELIGLDISDLSPPRRSSEGLGRTFQAATLFPELTVRESVQVALEARERSSFVKSALFLNGPAERRKRNDADDLIDFLGLGRYADNFISDLSTGTRRIVEIAGLLAVDAELLCLDEPTAGIAQRETEAFGPIIVEIRKELGASMLIIEHDMPLIMSISDRVYCLESGAVIAAGEPEAVRNNSAVIASYLGTDDRAIERSDQSPQIITTMVEVNSP